MVFSDSSRVWPMDAHPLMIRPSKPSPTQRPDMFRPCGYSTKYSVPLDFGGLRCSAHYRAMITTAWELGARHATGDPPFRQWAHRLGYGGHFLTKSRRYSVTFGQLRAARTSYRRAQRHPDGERDPWDRPLDENVVLVLSTWPYAGTSHNTATPGAEPAAASAARPRAPRPGRRLLTLKRQPTLDSKPANRRRRASTDEPRNRAAPDTGGGRRRTRHQAPVHPGGSLPNDRHLWPYAVRSISDWKNDYLDICHSCSVRNACGGVFTTSGNRLSQHLRPLP